MPLANTLDEARRLRAAVLGGADDHDVSKFLEGDYIPGGAKLDNLDRLYGRQPATGLERCGVQTGDDLQSGPMYCGDLAVATYRLDGIPGACLCVCKRHDAPFKRRCEENETKRLAASEASAAL